MILKKLLIPFFLLVVSLGVLLVLVKSPLASVFYPNAIAHSFAILAITGVLFFVCFFSYQIYAREKDIRYYIVSLSLYFLGILGFIHSVMVPIFGWGNEELFDVSEHYGFFLASFLLWGLIIPFSGRFKEKIYLLRNKIFIGATFLLLACFGFIFFLPPIAGALFESVNFFIILTGINFLLLFFVLLTRKEDNFFIASLSRVLAIFITVAAVPLFYQEWNVIWWYYHFLWLSGPLLLLLLLLREKKGEDVPEILFSSFSIRTRLSFIVGFMLVTTVANGLIDLRLSQNHLQVQTLENLVLMADMQEGQILGWLDALKGRTVDFASDGFIRESLEKIITGDRQAATDLNWYLLNNKLPLDSEVFGIHVMNLNGKVVASSQGNEVGKEDMSADNLFIQAKSSRYGNAYASDIIEDLHFGQRNIAIIATAPIIDQAKSENIGVIMLFFKAKKLSDILTGKAQSQSGALSTWTARNKTFEMYLVNKNKVMMSESRFIMNAALKEEVDTVPVRSCVKSEEMSGEYLNYHKVSVFGASMCLPNDWVLLAEINKSEVLATLGDYFQQNLLSVSATFLLILFAVYLFAVSIISPLKGLSVVAQKIGAGDFTARVKRMTNDEFGELSDTFNQMAESIQKGNAVLLQKAKEEEVSRQAVTNILEDLEVAKKQIEREKAKDDAIFSSIGDGLIVTDDKGVIIQVNEAFEKLLGWSAKEVIGEKMLDVVQKVDENGEIIPPAKRSLHGVLTGVLSVGRISAITKIHSYIRKDKSKLPIIGVVTPIIFDDKIAGAVQVFRDVTDEKEIDKAKTEFVSLASHQLRTPLSTINWYVEMLLSGDAGEVNENQGKYLEEAYRASRRMVDLVNALLNVSRLELGTFVVEPEPTDVAVLARSVIDEQKPQINERKIKISSSFEKNIPLIPADPKLLRMVIQNLLSNAVKYTPEGGKIELFLSLDKDKKNLLMKLSDTGYGIPKNQQGKIFSKLFRADNVREKDTDGTGLGLYIVKSIIEHSGGKAWFESEENKGTTFFVALPLEGMKKKEGARSLS